MQQVQNHLCLNLKNIFLCQISLTDVFSIFIENRNAFSKS